MLKPNFLKNKLKNGNAVLGTWSTIPSAYLTDILASSKLDFIIIDNEHGPLDYATAQQMIIACESHQVSPVIRVPYLNESHILKALDIGTHCVQIPNINSQTDVEKAIEYAKYPPQGLRGFSPFTRAGGYSYETHMEYTKNANENTLIAIHIEGTSAIDNIDEILKYESLDIVFIGLFDLSKSLGLPNQVNHPKVTMLLEKLVKKINQAKKFAGTICVNLEQMNFFLNLGIKYLTYSVDCEIIQKSYRDIQHKFHQMTMQLQ